MNPWGQHNCISDNPETAMTAILIKLILSIQSTLKDVNRMMRCCAIHRITAYPVKTFNVKFIQPINANN